MAIRAYDNNISSEVSRTMSKQDVEQKKDEGGPIIEGEKEGQGIFPLLLIVVLLFLSPVLYDLVQWLQTSLSR